jgi:hypothetical protein
LDGRDDLLILRRSLGDAINQLQRLNVSDRNSQARPFERHFDWPRWCLSLHG